MSKEWYKYTIFISSTFRDMDAERDAIKFDVISRLNWHYRSQRVSFQAVDLRIGINTESVSEEDSENMVLDVCLGNIDKARPFFIGLLGHRYGWIPSEQRWSQIVSRLSEEKRLLVKDSCHCSVTEMEILYGAIGNNGKHLNHCLFFFRDEHSYDGMTESQKLLFFNQDDITNKLYTKEYLTKRENELKNRILSVVWNQGKELSCTGYSLKWDPYHSKFESTEKFAELVFNELCREIDKEISINTPPQTWQEQENITLKYLIYNLTNNKIRLKGVEQTIKRAINGEQVLLKGAMGCGKSVSFAYMVQHFQTMNNCYCLVSLCGSTHRNLTMFDIALRWVYELESVLGQHLSYDNTSEIKPHVLYERLVSLIRKIKTKGDMVIVMMDAIDHFLYTSPNDIFLSWLPDDIAFIGTTNTKSDEICLHHSKMQIVNAEITNPDAIRFIGRNHEKRFNLELPKNIRRDIVSGKLSPLGIDMIMRMFSSFSHEDFESIRKIHAESEIGKINCYMDKLYHLCPMNDLPGLFVYIVNFIISRIDSGNTLLSVLKYIAISGVGLTEDDLSAILQSKWDALKFHKLMAMLDDYFIEDNNSHRWFFASPAHREAFIPSGSDRKTMFQELASFVFDKDNDNQLKQDILFYLLIETGNPLLGRNMLTDINLNSTHRHGNWYEISLIYLLQDKDLGKRIKNLCDGYKDIKDIVGFVHYFYNSLPQNECLPLLCQIEEDLLKNIEIEQLDDENSYHLAYFYSHLFSTHEQKLHPFLNIAQGNTALAPYYLNKSIIAFKHCYEMNPSYADVGNMLKAMLLAKIQHPNYCKKTEDVTKLKQLVDNIKVSEIVTSYDKVKQIAVEVRQMVSESRLSEANGDLKNALHLAETAFSRVCDLVESFPEQGSSYVVYVNSSFRLIEILDRQEKYLTALKICVHSLQRMLPLINHLEDGRSCVILLQTVCFAMQFFISGVEKASTCPIFRDLENLKLLYCVSDILQESLKKIEPNSKVFLLVAKYRDFFQKNNLTIDKLSYNQNLPQLITKISNIVEKYDSEYE